MAITPFEGKSLMPFLREEINATHDILFGEHKGRKAFRAGDWKISSLKNGKWELFNLAEDFSETNNLADRFPENVREMEKEWKTYYEHIKL